MDAGEELESANKVSCVALCECLDVRELVEEQASDVAPCNNKKLQEPNVYVLSILQGIGCGAKIHGHHGLDDLLEFVNLGFRNSLDIRQFASGGMGNLLVRLFVVVAEIGRKERKKQQGIESISAFVVVVLPDASFEIHNCCGEQHKTYRFDRVVAGILKLLNVTGGYAMFLKNFKTLKADCL